MRLPQPARTGLRASRSALVATALLATAATPSVRAPGPFDYDTVEIAPNLYGFFEKRLNPIVSSNIIAVIGTDAVLLFDTGHHPSITRQIAGDLRRLTDKPVRYVVISHWHDDHWAGNAEIARAYPGVQIIAHTFTAKMIESRRRDSFRGEACRKDLVDSSRPLRNIERMDVARIVPGHGPVMRDNQYLRDVAETLESISRQAKAAYRPGMTADQLRAAIDLAALGERFSHGDAFLRANFDAQMKGSAIDRIWQELSGATETPAPRRERRRPVRLV